MKRLLVLLVALVASIAVYAQTCPQYRYAGIGIGNGAWFSSAGAAAGAWWGNAQAAGYFKDSNVTQSICGTTENSGLQETYYYGLESGTNVLQVHRKRTGTCSGSPVNSDSIVQQESAQTEQGTCQPTCTAGSSAVRNLTTGWNNGMGTDSSTIEYLPSGAVAPPGYMGPMTGYTGSGNTTRPTGNYCINSCTHELASMSEQIASGQWREYSDRDPTGSTGKYRQSGDYLFKGTGAACSPGTSEQDKALDPATPAPACDGVVGEVAGKDGKPRQVCVPKSYGDANKVPRTQGLGPVTQGNPKAGSQPSDATRSTGSGGSSGSSSAGDGTVILPGGGTVTPTGSGPSGTTTVGGQTVQQACGAPGQPKCEVDTGVRFDTPDGNPLPTATKELTYTPDSSVNLGSGSCPSGFTWTDRMGSHSLNLAPFCDKVSTIIKPLVLLAASLAAFFIIGGFSKGDE